MSLLPPGISTSRFLPRPFGGAVNPPDFDDLAASERPYAFGWKWAHFLWHLRKVLHDITGDWLEADRIITLAHFKPRLPENHDGLSAAENYQHSLRTTIALRQISLSDEAWSRLLAAHPLTA